MSAKQITLPSESGREDPIYKEAVQTSNDPSKSAVFIFLHGLADSAEAIQSMLSQCRSELRTLTLPQMLPTNSNKVESCHG